MSSKSSFKIFLPYGEHPESQNVPGSEWEPVYKYDAVKDNIFLSDEQKNLQNEIDSYLDGTRIYDILDKYVGISDPEHFSQIPQFNKTNGQYLDITDLPTNLHELKQLGEKVQEKIKELNNVNRVDSSTDQADSGVLEKSKQEKKSEIGTEKGKENIEKGVKE